MIGLVKIVNVIASTKTNMEIDIEELSQKLMNAEYNPEMFSGLIYRRDNKPTIIMFATGKLSSHGARSETAAKRAIIEVLSEIKNIGGLNKTAHLENINIVNVVGTVFIGYRIDIEELSKNLPNTIYDPEQFPGLIYRPSNDSVVCMIFSTGKIVIVGCNSEVQIRQTYQQFQKTLARADYSYRVES